jgi:hypothetical protein
MSFLTITETRPHSWIGCEPMTNDERRGEWAAKYYAGGYQHLEQTFDDNDSTDNET